MNSLPDKKKKMDAVIEFIQRTAPETQFSRKPYFLHLGIDIRNPRPSTMTFCNSFSFLRHCTSLSKFTCIVTRPELYDELMFESKEKYNCSFILAADPKNLFFRLHNFLADIGFYQSEAFHTLIEPTAKISHLSSISEVNVLIGENTIIEDFVVIKSNVVIGNNCRIQAGAVIGNDCLQCAQDGSNLYDVDHVGGVIIGDHVKIESNSLICRHIFDENTIIKNHSKIGGLSHVAHGCVVEEKTILAPNVFLGGGTHVGSNVFVGANATTIPMVYIGDNVKISAGAVVTTDVKNGQHFSGNFAIPHEAFIRNLKESINP